MVRRSREIYAQHGTMYISAKYSFAHSHVSSARRYTTAAVRMNATIDSRGEEGLETLTYLYVKGSTRSRDHVRA